MVIVETSMFTKLIRELMTDDQYRILQEALVVRPDTGDLIKGSGGLRKMRWNLFWEHGVVDDFMGERHHLEFQYREDF